MIKVNASAFVSDLGGGSHGHLGILITESEYSKITGTTYKKSEHPEELKIKEHIALYDDIILRELHNEKYKFSL